MEHPIITSRVLRGVLRPATAILLVAAALTTVSAESASAHDTLVASVPAADEVVITALNAVTLTFSEAPLADAPSTIQVTDLAGVSVVAGEVTPSETSLSVPVGLSLTGPYRVVWQTVSSDGHTVSGEYGFTYNGPVTPVSPSASPSPSPSPSSSPTASAEPSASPSASPRASGSATQAPGEPASSVNGFLPLIIGVLIIVAIVIAFAIARAVRARRNAP